MNQYREFRFAFCVMIVAAGLVCDRRAVAQSAMKPQEPAPFNFNNLMLCKATTQAGKPAVSFLVTYFTVVERDKIEIVMKEVPVTKTRTIRSAQGEKTIEYSDMATVKEEQIRTTAKYYPNPEKRTVPIEDVAACTLNGQRLTEAELLQRLKKPTHVFILPSSEAADVAAGGSIEIEPFYRSVLREDVLVVYSSELADYLDNHVPLTIANNSGQTVDLYYVDGVEGEVKIESNFKSGADGFRLTVYPFPGIRYFAKANGKMNSEIWIPNEPHFFWEIGPPVEFTAWDGDNGVRFTRGPNNEWRQLGRSPKFREALKEVERTDQFVDLHDAVTDRIIRLTAQEAVIHDPSRDDWEEWATRGQEQTDRR